MKPGTAFIVDLGYLVNHKEDNFRFDQKDGPEKLKTMVFEKFGFQFQHLYCFTAVKDPAEEWVVRSNNAFKKSSFTVEISSLKTISIDRTNGKYKDGRKYAGEPVFRHQQACVDMHIALKIAQLISANQIKHLCILAGDGDFHKPLEAFKNGWIGQGYERISVLAFKSSLSTALISIANEHTYIDDWKKSLKYRPNSVLAPGPVLATAPTPEPEPVLPPAVSVLGARLGTYEISEKWTIVTGLSGGRIFFYNRVNALTMIYRMGADGNPMGEQLQNHKMWPNWDIITELPGQRILFNERATGRTEVHQLNPNGTLRDGLSSHTGGWLLWDVIVPLRDGNHLLFYRKDSGLGEIHRLQDDGQVCERTAVLQWNRWDTILALPEGRMFYYSLSHSKTSVFTSLSAAGVLGLCFEDHSRWPGWNSVTVVETDSGPKIVFYRRAEEDKKGHMEVYELF